MYRLIYNGLVYIELRHGSKSQTRQFIPQTIAWPLWHHTWYNPVHHLCTNRHKESVATLTTLQTTFETITKPELSKPQNQIHTTSEKIDQTKKNVLKKDVKLLMLKMWILSWSKILWWHEWYKIRWYKLWASMICRHTQRRVLWSEYTETEREKLISLSIIICGSERYVTVCYSKDLESTKHT